MAPSLYCSHSSAGNTMKSQFLSWDMESIKNSYANWSSGKTQKCLETMAWLSFPLLSRFCKGKKGQQLLWSWEYSIHVRAWKFMVMEWIFACSLCTSLIISLLFMSLVLVLDIPLELQIPSKKDAKIHPLFKVWSKQKKKQKQKIEFKGRRRGQNKVGSLLSVKVKCLFYCYLFTNPRDLDKKLWVAQCQSHLNITENWWVAATKIPCTTFWKKSGQPFSAVIFGVLESFFIYFTTANDITERKYSPEGE